MARKNQQIKVVRPAEQAAACNLASVVNQHSALRLLLRAPRPLPARRRVTVLMLGGPPEPVKIRHVSQDVDSEI